MLRYVHPLQGQQDKKTDLHAGTTSPPPEAAVFVHSKLTTNVTWPAHDLEKEIKSRNIFMGYDSSILIVVPCAFTYTTVVELCSTVVINSSINSCSAFDGTIIK